MILNKLKYFLLLLFTFSAVAALAQQTYPAYPGQTRNYMRDTVKQTRKMSDDEMMDSTRKQLDRRRDTVVFTSKYIKVTNERLLNDSTQVFAIDTGLINFENYSPLLQPRSPRISLGSTGLPQRPLLFEPYKNVGFDIGQHTLDPYLLTPADIQYYRARVPYTNLYYIGGHEQIFRAVHSQNIRPNWNVGLNFNVLGSKGTFLRQNVSDLSAAIFNWYESKSKRYNLLANVIFNRLKVPESGSLTVDSVFKKGVSLGPGGLMAQSVKLNASSDQLISNGLYLKQFYYIGRIDSLRKGSDSSKVLPTNRISHTFYYNSTQFKFLQNDNDLYHVFPDYYYSATNSRDSLIVHHLQNEFTYTFYLRGKSVNFVKNELKVDLGLVHDLYQYRQYVLDSLVNIYGAKTPQPHRLETNSFQNITLKARLGYRFSNRINLDANLQQVAQGYNFGDYLYDAKLNVYGGSRAGRIILEAYTQNNRAPYVYTNWISNHYNFTGYDFSKQKTTSLSFNYINDKLQLDVKAEYFLINNYLYFTAQPGGIDAHPAQAGSPVSLLKLSAGKYLAFGRWHFDNYIVYQKTDNQNLIRTPELYTYSSLYYAKLLFNVLNSNIGFNVRYNTRYVAPSYAVGLGQFYNGPDVNFTSYPVASIFGKATLYRTNLFVQYSYANQGLFSNGYYQVNRYPISGRLLSFGVSWTFYQ